VRTAQGEIDARLETQLARIADELLEDSGGSA
jgi:flagellar biosynthesis/type III secretory pathway protein FliH